MKKVKKSNVLLTCGLMFFGAGLAVGSVAGIQNDQHYQVANADDPVSYIYRSWDETNGVVVEEERTCSTYTVLASSNSNVNLTDGGWYVVKSNITFNHNKIIVNGTVNLILCDGYKLSIAGQIQVKNGNSLNIYGQSEDSGQIVANNTWEDQYGNQGGNGAGIGGYDSASGDITIFGGNITANGNDTAGNRCAGIGGGAEYGAGPIKIYGGTVTADGGYSGAGIGGGAENGAQLVEIYGGTVTATGGNSGAGIGGGIDGNCGTVKIHGGTVTATGTNYGAGIGGGMRGAGGTVTIDGGTVTATGNKYAAGIGGGVQGAGGNVTITGGTVTATGGDSAAGIGAGYGASGHGTLTVGEGIVVFGGSSENPKEILDNYATTRTRYMIVKESAPRDPVSYISRTWDGSKIVEEEKTLTKYKLINNCEAGSTELTDANGWYVLNNDHSLINYLAIKGNINLVLCDGFTLSLKLLAIHDGFTLNVYGQSGGTGTLSVHEPDTYIEHAIETRGSNAALNIYGGTVNATADREGAGIDTTGLISIYGGTVNATGSDGWYAAGIGGKYGQAGGTVNIYGGEVRANGGQSGNNYAVGIGGGGTSSSHGTINLLASNLRVYGNNTSKDLTALDMKTDYATTRWRYMAVLPAPEYTVPTGLEIEYGHTLADITLPDNWSWIDPTASVGEVGTHQFQATYIPEGYIGILENISITVGKATPEYTVPTGLEAIVEDDLSDIALPEHWSWKTPTDSAGDVGEHQHVAIYTPEDPNYKTVEETLTVTVKPAPIISIESRTWEDGVVKTTTITCDNYHKIKSTTLDLTTGWYVLRNDVHVETRITITGEVNIILVDGCTLTVEKGVIVNTNNTLNIYGQTAGTGKLVANTDSHDDHAAIGGDEQKDSGIINIFGGTIEATSKNWGAAIGGGYKKSAGGVNIYGGTITATCDYYSSAIGGGNGGNGGTVTIYGGTISAYSELGTGIGGGNDASSGTITINGGNITARGGGIAAAIGGGNRGSADNVTINGGTITASSVYGAGIGGGENAAGGTVVFNGGKVIATGGAGAAGIGGGKSNTNHGTLTVANGYLVYGGDSENPTTVQTDYETTRWRYMILDRIPHEHNYDTTVWEKDEHSHWHPCLNENCDQPRGNEASHAFGENINADDYTVCSICGYVSEGRASAKSVYNDINGLANRVKYSEDWTTSVHNIRTAYNALGDEYKTLVTNYQTLVDAEADLAKYVADNEAADAVDALINAIGNVEYSQTCKDKIDAARTAYDALTDDQKTYVDNYQILTHAEEVYAHINGVVEKIDEIGSVTYEETCKDKIDIARAAYNALTDEEKNAFPQDKLNVLLAAEAAYKS